MLTGNIIHVNFDYALSENIMVKLKADINCDYVAPAYVVRSLEVINNAGSNNFPNEIKIIPVVCDDHIEWLHAGSLRSSILSKAIGKAIESTGEVAMLRMREAAA